MDQMSIRKEGRKIEDFGKEARKKLIDIDQTQEWLRAEVNAMTGLHISSDYLAKILNGKKHSKRVTGAIKIILGL